MSAISFILLPLLMPLANAASFEVPVAAGDRLVLKGFEAQVQITSQPGTSMKVSGLEESASEGNYTMVKRGNVIEIKMTEHVGKKSWMGVLPRASSQMKKIDIWGPSVPVDIQLHGGSVVAQKWAKDLKVSLTQGRVSSSNGTGTVQIYAQKGDVLVQDHNGKVEADSYSGTMGLKNIVGDVDANLFSGQLQVEKVRGFLALSTQNSVSKVNQGSGTIQFENGKGSLSITGFQGRTEGQNQEGAVTIAMSLDSEVDVKSKSGRISVQVPPASGISLNLLTVEGEIVVPGELKVTKLSAEKSVRGRLRGDAQRGSVFVRSQDGTISVK